jgi:glycosyltransferase involved in cell wall biosynthesis
MTLTALMPVKAFHERFLHEAVDSVIEQTDPAWRLLIIGERPGLGRLRQTLAGALEDPRIDLIANEGRKLAGAFNTGMRAADTAFVAILLGDDLWAPNAVEVLGREIAADPTIDFFHSARRFVDDDGNPVSEVMPPAPHVSPELFLKSSPVKHLLCWRRELALGIGGMDESLNSVGPDDFDFPWLMADHGAVFKGVPECLYVYRDHRSSFRLTTHLPLAHHKREIARIMAKHGAPPEAIERRVARAEQSYLRQCLYRSRLDRLLKAGRTPEVWRQPYA